MRFACPFAFDVSFSSRRTFLIRAGAAALAPRLASFTRLAPLVQDATTPNLRVALLSAGGPTQRARHDGALLGVEEAEHAAKLFGGRAELVIVRDVADLPRGVSAILGDESLSSSRAVARSAAANDYLFINVACTSDTLRGAECAPRMFHVCPSEQMLRDACAQFPANGASCQAVAWDPALVRFGADTLNQRFKKRFGVSMTPEAWGAWFAVKVLWESALRMKSALPSHIAEYLTRDTTQFDGHKGRPLSFRAWDHQLRQFVYVHADGRVVDVPQNAPADATSREFLDRIGTTVSSSSCHFAQ